MKFLGICLAGFSEMFYNNNGNRIMKATSSMYTGKNKHLSNYMTH